MCARRMKLDGDSSPGEGKTAFGGQPRTTTWRTSQIFAEKLKLRFRRTAIPETSQSWSKRAQDIRDPQPGKRAMARALPTEGRSGLQPHGNFSFKSGSIANKLHQNRPYRGPCKPLHLHGPPWVVARVHEGRLRILRHGDSSGAISGPRWHEKEKSSCSSRQTTTTSTTASTAPPKLAPP